MTAHDPATTPNPAFPNLTPSSHRVIGPASPAYNCIAWACGDTGRWWQPGPHYYWPIPADPDDASVNNLLAALGVVGFAVCPDGLPEPGFEKVAVFAAGADEYTHAARQLASGKWTSKLGLDALIEHDTPEAVSGGVYGEIVAYMKRPTPAPEG